MNTFILEIIIGLTLFGCCLIILFHRKKVREGVKKTERILLQIRPNRLSERGPGAMEQVFSALHGIHQKRNLWQKLIGVPQPCFSLEMINAHGQTYFLARIEATYAPLLESQFYAHYPDCEIRKIKDYTTYLPKNVVWTEMEFTSADLWPIKRYSQFEDKAAKMLNDPLSGVLLTLSKLLADEQVVVQICASPLDAQSFRQRGTECLRILKKGVYKSNTTEEKFSRVFMNLDLSKKLLQSPLRFYYWLKRLPKGASSQGKFSRGDTDPEMEMNRSHDRENEITAASDKLSRLPYRAAIRIACFTDSKTLFSAESKVAEICGAFKQFNTPQLNGFEKKAVQKNNFAELVRRLKTCNLPQQMIMSNEELATVFHLPNRSMSIPNLDTAEYRKIEPPKELPLQNCTKIGMSNFRSKQNEFGIKEDDRRRHVYIVGKTGMGKSTLLENMIFSDIQEGKGVAVIDPHGDLADAVLDFVPKSRTNDVVLFDPGDVDFPVSFNMLECQNPLQRHLVASGVLGVFKKLFAESWGPRLEHILRNTLMALIEAGGTSLLGVMRMLGDDKYRAEILKEVADPMVLSFWETEFGKWSPKQVTEAVSPIQNKVGQFLSSSLIRNILGQTKSTIDLRFAMDKGKIIIVNLSKGKIGEDNSALLGAMLITKFQLDVMSRSDTPEKDRQDFYLYVDEFQNFATDSFATILSEARKYRLNLTVANQYLAQMEETVQDAVFGNVGTMITFQVGYDDARVLSDQFGGEEVILPADIGQLPKYATYLRLMINGMPSPVFSATTLPPPRLEEDPDRRERILKVCRQRYAKQREKVEEKIMKWVKGRR